MKATGIVRRIDDLGRVVIPKEIRRTLRIHEGDPLEIFVDHEGDVILKKYSPIGQLADFAQECADSLFENSGHIAMITDRDTIISVAGISKKEYLEKEIGPDVEAAMDERTVVIRHNPKENGLLKHPLEREGEPTFMAYLVTPIISGGDPIGTVILASKQAGAQMGGLEQKLAETTAAVLGKQMEA